MARELHTIGMAWPVAGTTRVRAGIAVEVSMGARALLLGASFAIAASVSLAARAEQEAPPPPPPRESNAPPPTESYGSKNAPADAEEPTAPGVRMQDGLYISLGIGGGYFTDGFDQQIAIFRDINGKATGASASFQLAIGGTPKPGVVIGGAALVEQVTDPKIEIEGLDVSGTDNIDVGTFFVVGPFIDYYFTPGDGFHVMGVLGLSSIRVRDKSGNVDEEINPAGAGGAAMLGYNLWVADQWSVGLLGRFTAGALVGDNVRHSVTAGSLLLVGTYQ